MSVRVTVMQEILSFRPRWMITHVGLPLELVPEPDIRTMRVNEPAALYSSHCAHNMHGSKQTCHGHWFCNGWGGGNKSNKWFIALPPALGKETCTHYFTSLGEATNHQFGSLVALTITKKTNCYFILVKQQHTHTHTHTHTIYRHHH